MVLNTAPSWAQNTDVYQCKDQQDKVSFQDHPCNPDDSQQLLSIGEPNIANPVPSPVESQPQRAQTASDEAPARAGGLKQNCFGISIESFSALGISLEHTTAPALDGFWGDATRGLARRPNLKLEDFNRDVNDVAVCANIQFVLSTFGGEMNRQNNLGRRLRSRFVARSASGHTTTALSGSFADGRIKLGGTYSGTYCFWKTSQAGIMVELGCQ